MEGGIMSAPSRWKPTGCSVAPPIPEFVFRVPRRPVALISTPMTSEPQEANHDQAYLDREGHTDNRGQSRLGCIIHYRSDAHGGIHQGRGGKISGRGQTSAEG